MEIKLPFDFNQGLSVFLRRCGYAEFSDINSGQTSYTRRLGSDFYPRFHVYVKQQDGTQVLSLHLDQKKPSYPGASAHNGEYDGAVVQEEVMRIVGLIKNQMNNQMQAKTSQVKRGFLARLFS